MTSMTVPPCPEWFRGTPREPRPKDPVHFDTWRERRGSRFPVSANDYLAYHKHRREAIRKWESQREIDRLAQWAVEFHAAYTYATTVK